MKLNEKDTKLLEILQENCRMSLKEVAKETKRPITTIHEKLKRFEKEGLIKKYTAILDCEKLDFGQTVFVFVSIKYHFSDETKPLSQREIAKKISRIPNVQDVHIIAGDWDILVKVKGKNIKEISSFVIDKLRTIKGVDRTFTATCMETVKESSEIALS